MKSAAITIKVIEHTAAVRWMLQTQTAVAMTEIGDDGYKWMMALPADEAAA